MTIHISFPRPHRLGQPLRKAKIERCSDSGYWYADKVGQTVVVEFIDNEGYWSREGGIYNCINVIRKQDATLLPLEN